MSRAIVFERYWAEFDRPDHPVAESLPPSPDIARVVATATALRSYGGALPALDFDSTWQSLAARLESAPGIVPMVPPHPAVRRFGRGRSAGTIGTVSVLRPRLGRTVRVAAAAVAVMIVLATASLRAPPGSTFYPVRLTVEQAALAIYPNRGETHLRLAEARLGDLLVALRQGPVQAAPALARALVENRAAAGSRGAKLRELDLRIAMDVPPALVATPFPIATSVKMILGDLLPSEEPPPAQPGDDVASSSGEKQGSPSHRGEGSGKEFHDGHERERKDKGRSQGNHKGKSDSKSDKDEKGGLDDG